MKSLRRPASAVGLAFGLATLALVASGCSVASPAVITEPYAASDGVNAEVDTVKLRNFLVISEAEGEPGVVVGALATDGSAPVDVQLTMLDAAGQAPVGSTTVKVEPGLLTKVGAGADAEPFQLDEVPVKPGSALVLQASTRAGRLQVKVPVLRPEAPYENVTPTAPASSPSPS